MAVAPPRPKGPPLNALRAFEAAARLRSFSLAALELNVSAGAVAQHVKAVELWAGASLFERHAQGVRLNQIGERILPDFEAAFDLLAEATRKLRLAAAPSEIRIAALPSVAQLWLSPRLPKIRSAIPEVSISVTALEQAPNLIRDQYDLSLFFQEGEGALEDGSIVLAEDEIYPVAAPGVAAEISSAEDLAAVPCLEDVTWSSDWAIWLKAAGAGKVQLRRGPAFSLFALALEETRNGAGVLIGHDQLIRPDLEQGRLVRLFHKSAYSGRRLVLSVAQAGHTHVLQRVTDLLSQQTGPV